MRKIRVLITLERRDDKNALIALLKMGFEYDAKFGRMPMIGDPKIRLLISGLLPEDRVEDAKSISSVTNVWPDPTPKK
ncbi:MAG: hypothetical protein Q8P37_00740 [Candidatus Spechtbacteria bacterium]|nr:hypothetical protein [Candidatus Spechtbacteria bacterium]